MREISSGMLPHFFGSAARTRVTGSTVHRLDLPVMAGIATLGAGEIRPSVLF
jgi:hypothetical protein